jgi:hypothetical protein
MKPSYSPCEIWQANLFMEQTVNDQDGSIDLSRGAKLDTTVVSETRRRPARAGASDSFRISCDFNGLRAGKFPSRLGREVTVAVWSRASAEAGPSARGGALGARPGDNNCVRFKTLQNQKEQTFDVLPKPANLISYRDQRRAASARRATASSSARSSHSAVAPIAALARKPNRLGHRLKTAFERSAKGYRFSKTVEF